MSGAKRELWTAVSDGERRKAESFQTPAWLHWKLRIWSAGMEVCTEHGGEVGLERWFSDKNAPNAHQV